ncbi:MAG: STAS-like domain-containing protein [Legionellales bacterium]
MNIIHLVLPSGDLASRSLAIPERQEIEKIISKRAGIVEIDLRCVKSISESYADELFGILVRDYGIDEIFSNIRLLNAGDYILESIASAMARRSNESESTSRLVS